MNEPEKQRSGSETAWMLTFADVLALLLTFFVMMYAMNEVRDDEWQGLAAAMAGQFNPANPPSDFSVQAGIGDASVREQQGMDLGYLKTLIEQKLSAPETAGAYEVSQRADGLHIELPEVVLIQQGQLVLTPSAYAAARELGQVLHSVGNSVSVHGNASHGADGALYASPWEVSLAAALMVADTITEAGYERKILALGHGDAYLGKDASTGTDDGSGAGLSWGRVDVVVRDVESNGDRGEQ